MERISRLLVDLTVKLADAPLERHSAVSRGPVEDDTVELELSLFREAFGPLIPTTT